MKKFWKKVILDFEIRINLVNYNNSFRKKYKIRTRGNFEKNRVREESHGVEKVTLIFCAFLVAQLTQK